MAIRYEVVLTLLEILLGEITAVIQRAALLIHLVTPLLEVIMVMYIEAVRTALEIQLFEEITGLLLEAAPTRLETLPGGITTEIVPPVLQIVLAMLPVGD